MISKAQTGLPKDHAHRGTWERKLLSRVIPLQCVESPRSRSRKLLIVVRADEEFEPPLMDSPVLSPGCPTRLIKPSSMHVQEEHRRAVEGAHSSGDTANATVFSTP